ncbi:MAG: ATP-dependent zinc metalloprotease FtsH [Clostridia bacterium]|nr:ATP-dependent zinc metalloprotease FtsH [Clostridia bacterium]
MKPNIKRMITIAGFLVLATLMYLFIMNLLTPKPVEKDPFWFFDYYEAQSKSNDSVITRLVIEDDSAIMYEGDLPKYKTNFTSRVTFETRIFEIRQEIKDDDTQSVSTIVPIDVKPLSNGNIIPSIISIATTILFVVIMFIILRQMMGAGKSGTMGFGKSRARANENVKVRFNDVAGAEEEKEELKEIVEFLKSPKKFSELGARIPKGVLLVGPPGTGKTLFAKAVAGEANVPFFSISGSDFVEMFVGVGASRVRDMFEVAKKNMPCIVFIDEIDAVGRQRGAGLGGGHDEREQTLNQLLVQMDGFETNEGIIIMAATNRADILDPALLRPGRFDRQIFVNIPDVRGREAILKVHSRNKPLASDINFKTIARLTGGFSGADIENLLNEAAILAVRAGRKIIEMGDIYEGINKVIMGPQKRSRLITEADRRITSYHESGHAIIAKSLPHCDPVHEISIIPRGKAAGYTMTRPDSDEDHISKNKMLSMITMMLGGRAAEEIIIQDVCAGAISDLQRSTEIARKMVKEFGMSKLGLVYYGTDKDVFIGRDFSTHNKFSEEMNAKIDAEVSEIMTTCYKKAIDILTEKQSILENMARVLIERETIYSEDVQLLMEGNSAEEVIKQYDKRYDIKNKKEARVSETKH